MAQGEARVAPEPVDGEVIHYSRMHIFMMFAIGIGLILVGAASVPLIFYGGALGGFVFCSCVVWAILAPLVGIFLVVCGVLTLIWRSRLILGDECYQMVNGSKVSEQIPYANIVAIRHMKNGRSKEEKDPFLGIELAAWDDPETYFDNESYAKSEKKKYGFDAILKDTWRISLAEIRTKILKKMKSARPDDTK